MLFGEQTHLKHSLLYNLAEEEISQIGKSYIHYYDLFITMEGG
jgi:hypothetical protein